MSTARPLLALLLLGLAGLALAAGDQAPNTIARPPGGAALIEIAILLDTSSSMDGLIDQARARLWAIVNNLAKTSKGGKAPDLRVALYEYGNNHLAPAKGWIKQVLPLTDDLDGVSAALFALKTDGGEEYCGQVIQRAVHDLGWHDGDHYRAIFIAGNEPFTQGPVPYTTSCKEAIGKGIVVNTIHCGPAADGLAGKWVDGAKLADGESMNIDQDHAEVAIAAPQDPQIAALNAALNNTYLGYGAAGEDRKALQVAQDANAAAASPSSFSARAMAKSGGQYRNSSWDLVDAVKEKQVDLATAKREELPAEMKDMNADQRQAFVAAKAAERAKLQQELAKLASERDAHVAAERAKLGGTEAATFGAAVQRLLDKQLQQRGYQSTEK